MPSALPGNRNVSMPRVLQTRARGGDRSSRRTWFATCNDRAMPDAETIWLFCLAATALIVIPGPSVLYIVAQSIGQGRRAGVISALGVATGGLVHVVGATIGISSILLSSATLFSVFKFIGAGYLIYL